MIAEFVPSVNLELMELIWAEEFIRNETEQTLTIRQAKAKDPTAFFLEMQRLRREEVKAYTEKLKASEELQAAIDKCRELVQELEQAQLELAALRVKPGEVDAAEARIEDMLVQLQRDYERERNN